MTRNKKILILLILMLPLILMGQNYPQPISEDNQIIKLKTNPSNEPAVTKGIAG